MGRRTINRTNGGGESTAPASHSLPAPISLRRPSSVLACNRSPAPPQVPLVAALDCSSELVEVARQVAEHFLDVLGENRSIVVLFVHSIKQSLVQATWALPLAGSLETDPLGGSQLRWSDRLAMDLTTKTTSEQMPSKRGLAPRRLEFQARTRPSTPSDSQSLPTWPLSLCRLPSECNHISSP